ncbi:Imm8 family immunity protein [Aneurinibacillus aneurinilyticus]|uniref:Immunity protein 8 n=1 Tax=Aneurinibacillus aneurinilyticus ATCC 12856 TaxID=649747 RepID=U1X9C2_ANEAE|nr:Imm8 family immunity protein [Aneurinibacillus aneurinilyticus]ERI11570.1 hypothetical protein HMPREF0083_00330 [Aneurinibacillus aneurinilyticus ATCC 12856]MED0709406.1 Imm8 family immunity protein [Aneurinibacillus aneurinilyticus]MED0726221.1 Imm8 family immunity protein [Aneurinibacillus aneurinilyticus]MED0735234.1 Imm8 family immunity protein [Aneurinibacillus aneurinilyticus]MED0744274.1 Imm8 family immunity protein [Aneurinibacillus aneurinilyticus]
MKLIVPELKGLHIISEDWGESLDNFWIQLHADIGTKGKEDVDIFVVYVVSPSRLQGCDIEVGRGLFIMSDFNISLLEQKIKHLLENCKRKTWEETALAINRYAYWDYENYQENS